MAGAVPSGNRYARSAATAQLELHRLRRRRRAVESLRRPLALSDELLSTLEDLHLTGRRRVPADLATELAALHDALPGELRRELRVGVSVHRLMDDIYRVQEALLSRLRQLHRQPDGWDGLLARAS